MFRRKSLKNIPEARKLFVGVNYFQKLKYIYKEINVSEDVL